MLGGFKSSLGIVSLGSTLLEFFALCLKRLWTGLTYRWGHCRCIAKEPGVSPLSLKGTS